jgi:hypothetical protein
MVIEREDRLSLIGGAPAAPGTIGFETLVQFTTPLFASQSVKREITLCRRRVSPERKHCRGITKTT